MFRSFVYPYKRFSFSLDLDFNVTVERDDGVYLFRAEQGEILDIIKNQFDVEHSVGFRLTSEEDSLAIVSVDMHASSTLMKSVLDLFLAAVRDGSATKVKASQQLAIVEGE